MPGCGGDAVEDCFVEDGSLAMLVKYCTQNFMVHAGQNVPNPDGRSPDHNPAIDVAFDRIWTFCRGRKRPTPLFTSIMEKRFDQLFGTVAGYAGLGRFLDRLTANREPLPVLDHVRHRSTQVRSDDLRTHVTRRKISFRTRSEAGRFA